MESETERDPEERLGDFREEEEERCVYRSGEMQNPEKGEIQLYARNKYILRSLVRSGSEETVDTVVAVSSAKKQQHTEAEQR